LESQVEKLEAFRNETATNAALEAQRTVYMTERFDRVDKEISEVKSGLLWAVRIFLGAALTAAAAFMIRGGFNIG
jgi:hypothetical protein